MVAVAALALAVWPPWQRVAWGATLPPRVPRAAFVAASPQAVGRFAPMLRPGEVDRVRAVAYDRDVVVAAFALTSDGCGRIDITRLRRVRRTLTVTVRLYSVARPNVGCLEAGMQAHDVVEIDRSLIGHPLPRRVRVQFAQSTNFSAK